MLDFPKSLLPQYLKLLEMRGVPAKSFAECIKWSRYFLDYCDKYPASISLAEQMPLFIEKLKAKKQSELKCRQAAYAVSVFIELQKNEASVKQSSDVDEHKPLAAYKPPPEPLNVPKRYGSQYSEAGYQEKSDSPEWDAVLASMAAEITVRHYSRKTLKTYAHWSRQFQKFLKNKSPLELTGDDVKVYLTHLAVQCRVPTACRSGL
jgi:hypothetical protein